MLLEIKGKGFVKKIKKYKYKSKNQKRINFEYDKINDIKNFNFCLIRGFFRKIL